MLLSASRATDGAPLPVALSAKANPLLPARNEHPRDVVDHFPEIGRSDRRRKNPGEPLEGDGEPVATVPTLSGRKRRKLS